MPSWNFKHTPVIVKHSWKYEFDSFSQLEMSTGLFFNYKTPFRILISMYAVPSLSSSLRFFNYDCSFVCSSLFKNFEMKIEYLFPIHSRLYIFKLRARTIIFTTVKLSQNFTRICLGRVFPSSNFPSRRKDEISIEFNPKFSKAFRISFSSCLKTFEKSTLSVFSFSAYLYSAIPLTLTDGHNQFSF